MAISAVAKKEIPMLLPDAINTFLLYYSAQGQSKNTIDLKRSLLKQMSQYFFNARIDMITADQIGDYFEYLTEHHVVSRKTSPSHLYKENSLRNHWSALRSLFAWAEASNHIVIRPDLDLICPPADENTVNPLKKGELTAMLTRAGFCPHNPTYIAPDANVALVCKLLILIDTGIRAGELCRLLRRDVRIRYGYIHIRRYGWTNHKTIERDLPISKTTCHWLAYYLNNALGVNDSPLFRSSRSNEAISRSSVYHEVHDLGLAAGISSACPLRIRHTFATEYMRANGHSKAANLKYLLGDTTDKMVEVYAQISSEDIHRSKKIGSFFSEMKIAERYLMK
jgi:integrase/recombinase XerD